MTTERRVVTRDEWNKARKALLDREKAFTRDRDAVSAARRELPMVKVEKTYSFEEPSGTRSLTDLFGEKKQLIVYHFMFDPSWEAGCKSCSLLADNFDNSVAHFGARNTAFAAISRAPVAKLEAFKKRMGWSFRWLSSANTDFNYDYQATIREDDDNATYNFAKASMKGELPGCSVFLHEGKDVFHTYSTYGRGLDLLIGTYNYLDLTPLGRDEAGLKHGMAWVRHHDKYDATS